MTAPNHALTGAVIGLSISNPFVALPLAFLSHFVCDLIPHYDPPTVGAKRLDSRRFLYEFIILGAAICFLIVLYLAIARPEHWVNAAFCAFAAASPDLFWIPRFIHVKRTGKDVVLRNWFLKFHSRLQWQTGPKLFWVEAVWFVVFAGSIVFRG